MHYGGYGLSPPESSRVTDSGRLRGIEFRCRFSIGRSAGQVRHTAFGKPSGLTRRGGAAINGFEPFGTAQEHLPEVPLRTPPSGGWSVPTHAEHGNEAFRGHWPLRFETGQSFLNFLRSRVSGFGDRAARIGFDRRRWHRPNEP